SAEPNCGCGHESECRTAIEQSPWNWSISVHAVDEKLGLFVSVAIWGDKVLKLNLSDQSGVTGERDNIANFGIAFPGSLPEGACAVVINNKRLRWGGCRDQCPPQNALNYFGRGHTDA